MGLSALLGALMGMVLALTGAGGGILAVPLLVLVLGAPMQQAAPMALMAVGLASAVGAAIGLKQGIVRYKAALLIGSMGVACAPLGTWASQRLDQRWLLLGFGLLMAVLALRQLFGRGAPARNTPPPCVVDAKHGRLIWTSACARSLAATGAFSGLLSGLIGVGGGFVIVPALSRCTDLQMLSIQATSLAVITLVSISATLAAAWHGQIAWAQATPFAAGAALALGIGRLVAARLSGIWLTTLFAWISLLAAGLMLAKALSSGMG